MILISAGHHPGAKGAVNPEGFSEYPETLKWCQELKKCLIGLGAFCEIVPTGGLTKKVAWINAYPPPRSNPVSLALEIHFNSSPGGRASGSETLYYPGSKKGQRYAEIVQGVLGGMMPPNRGVKEGWYKMDRPGVVDYHGDVDGDEKPDYFLAKTKYPALILEPEFIQRQDAIISNREVVCEELAKVLKGIDDENRERLPR